MSLFVQLSRKGFFETGLLSTLRKPRPKVSPKTIFKRKEAKRMRMMNKFSAEFTGEKPVHSWLDPKKVKALAAAYQEYRNKHRFNTPIDKKDVAELKEKSEYFADLFYFKWKEEQHMVQKAAEKQAEAQKEIEKLPYYLRDEMDTYYKRAKVPFDFPEEHHFLHLYYEQLMRILPDELAERIQVSMRLQAIATDTLGLGE